MTGEILRDAQEQLAQLQGLLKLASWHTLHALAQQQLTTRIDAVILNPASGADGVYAQEYMKGEIAGIKLFLQMPQLLIDQLQSDIDQMKGEENE